MRKYLLLLLFSLVYASSIESYLENGIGIKSISMGEAYYHQSDAESAYSNPALLSKAHNAHVQFVFNKKWEDMNELFLSVLYPMEQFNLGVSYFNSHLNNSIQGVSYDPNNNQNTLTGETYSYYASLLMLSFAKDIDSKLALGLNVKSFVKDLSVAKASALALDIGASYKINKEMNASIKISNILSTEYQWETEKEKPQIGLNAGVGLLLPGNININLGVKADPDNVSMLVGLEGSIDDALYYRGGFNKDVLSLGIGLKVDDISFDYSYSHYLAGEDMLGAVHRFGMSYEFDAEEKPVKKIKKLSNVQRLKASDAVDDLEAKYMLVLESDSVVNLQTLAGKLNTVAELNEQTATINIAQMRVKLIGNKVVLNGIAENVSAIWLGQKEIYIRPDKKFYIVGKYVKGGVTVTVIDDDGQNTDITLYRNRNKLVVKGKTELDRQPIWINDQVVFKRADGAFYKKIVFPKQVDFELRVIR